MTDLLNALRDDDRLAAITIGAGVAAHALIASGTSMSAVEVAKRAFDYAEAFVAEAERRVK